MNTCTYCNYSTTVKHHFQNHLLSQKHKKNEKQMKLMEEHKMFSCNTCEYHTKTKQNYNKHMQSKRHLEKEAGNLNNFICEVCNKPFGSYSGMLRHQNKCAIKTISENKQVQNALQLLQIQPLENKNVVININNNINSNNTVNNNIQNIQNILNEKCAKTPNLIDYVKSFKIKNEHMHQMHYKRSFVIGMTIVLLKNFDKIKKEKWPIFCVEEQTFIRDKDQWKLHDIDKIKEFVFAFYKIVNDKYIQNNIRNDEYNTRFIYKEIKEKMKNYIKDEDACTAIAEDIIKYFSMEKDEFSKIFGNDDEIDDTIDLSSLENEFDRCETPI